MKKQAHVSSFTSAAEDQRSNGSESQSPSAIVEQSRPVVIFSPDVTQCECFRLTQTHHTAANLPQPFDVRCQYRREDRCRPCLKPGEFRSTPEKYAVIIEQSGERKKREPAAVAGETAVDSHNSDQFGLPEDVCDNCRSGSIHITI